MTSKRCSTWTRRRTDRNDGSELRHLLPPVPPWYRHARDTDDAKLRHHVVERGADGQAPSVEIPVRLAGRECSLHFVGTHWFDLKTVLSNQESAP